MQFVIIIRNSDEQLKKNPLYPFRCSRAFDTKTEAVLYAVSHYYSDYRFMEFEDNDEEIE